MPNARGSSRIEVLVTVTLAVVVSAAALATGCGALDGSRKVARQVKDGTQQRQVHMAMVTSSQDTGGVYPLPGEINRLAVKGMQIPGRGNIDESVNQHANLWGAMVGRAFLTVPMLVSVGETNPNVVPCASYDVNRINPAKDVYWDDSPTGFQCDLSKACNTSYATMPLDSSSRRRAEWRNCGDARFAILGNRGVKGGALSGAAYSSSRSLAVMGTPAEWAGNTVYNDNHVEFGKTFLPDALRAIGTQPPMVPDNLFRNDAGALEDAKQRNSDCWLVIQREAAGTEASPNTTIDTADGGSFLTWD